MGIILGLVYLAVIVLCIAGLWKVFTKAGQPGWASLIPIYNLYVMLQIARKPVWWLIMFLIPCVGLIFCIMMWIEVCRKFQKGAGFAIGIIFLPFIFVPMLGFGDAQYDANA
jgi:hypothetical protein